MTDPEDRSLWFGFGSNGCTPQGTGIGTISIKLEHPVIKLTGGFRGVIQPNEVTNVLTRFFHISRAVIVSGDLMSRNNR